jgi:Tfp pilus assembly protein PilF
MSLINRVLLDLEDRHAFLSMQPQSVLSDLRSAQEYAQARSAAGRHVFVLGTVMILGLAVYLAGRALPVEPITGSGDGRAAARMERGMVARDPVPVATVPVASPAPELRLKLATLDVQPAAIVPAPVADSTAQAGSPKLLNFDVSGNGFEAAISLVFTSPPRYSLHVLEQPARLLVQMPRIDISPQGMQPLAAVGLVKGLRFGGDAATSKLIFDLDRPVEISSARIVPGSGDEHVLEVRLGAIGGEKEIPVAIDLMEGLTADVVLAAPEAEVVVAPAMEVVRRAPPQAGSAEKHFEQGAAAYRVGDMAAAIEFFHRAIAAEPGHLKARRFLVAVLLDQRDFESARRFAEEGLNHHARDPVLLRTLASVHFEQGDTDAALAVLSRNRPALKDDPDYYALMAAILQKQARHVEAAELYSSLLRLDPQRGVWWAGFGISLEALGRRAEAQGAFERVRADTSAPADLRRYATERIAAMRQAG